MTPVPLDPSPEQAREWLERELAHPDYHERNLLREMLDWVIERWSRLVEATADLSFASVAASILIAVALLAGLLWFLGRARRTASSSRRAGPLLPERRRTAAEYRALAEAAVGAGDYGTAVIEGFRALAAGQLERGRIEDHPEATARETAAALGVVHPEARGELASTAALFEEVRYGDHAASRDQAERVLALEAALDRAVTR